MAGDFVDQASIFVKAGDGGGGCVSFRREKYAPRGGPDGGDGGKGGSVIAVGDSSIKTLLDLRHKHHWTAQRGQDGMGSNKSGRSATDLNIHFPPGTLIFDANTDELIADLSEHDQIVLARGGRGGFGNDHFKSATNQAPRQSTPGEAGQEKTLRLELKLIADVGLVGMPNAGKSTLLSVLTRASPKVAEYPFTTLTPQLGIAEIDVERRLVFADIPGLIEGAADGAGLGHEFLRHIERTRVIVHLVEVEPADGSDPQANYKTIRDELASYSTTLSEKPELIVLSKTDLLNSDKDIESATCSLREQLKLSVDQKLFPISSAARLGLPSLLEACWALVQEPSSTVT